MLPADLERLEELDPPYEILELAPKTPVVLEITSFKIGKMKISPRFPFAPPEKEVAAIRVYLTEKSKPTFPHYYDITASRLVAQLAPILAAGQWKAFNLQIERDIPGPKAHFSVSLVPKE
jgi:hypothetical protein